MPCLDTTALIDLSKTRQTAHGRRLRDVLRRIVQNGSPLTTTRVNMAELYVGMERSGDRKGEEQRITQLTSALLILEFDDEAARVFGRILAHLYRLGRPSGDLDSMIASIAIVHNKPLITRNAKHFELMPDLNVVSY